MNNTEQTEFLGWKVLPARLDTKQAAWFLGFEPHAIPILIATGMLKPLGHPPRNSVKFFSTETLEQLRHDQKWLARATDSLSGYWRERNSRKKSSSERAKSGRTAITQVGPRTATATVAREPAPLETE